jgi:hypothetical protein
MAIALVTTASSNGSFGSAASSITHAITPTSGRALRVLVAGDTSFTPTVTDNASTPNTYNAKGNVTHTFYNQKVTEFLADNIIGGSITLTASYGGSSNMQWILTQEISGQALSAFDSRSTNYQPSPSPTTTDGITTGNATIVSQPNLLLGLCMGAGGTSIGTGFNFDSFGGNFPIAGVGYTGAWVTEYLRTTSTTAKAATWTNGSSGDYALSMLMVLDELVATAVNYRKTLSMLGGRVGSRQVQKC